MRFISRLRRRRAFPNAMVGIACKVGLAALVSTLAAACGNYSLNGAGGGGFNAPSGANVLPISVNSGPTGQYINGAFTTVTVCVHGTSNCQTIDNILVDTGSYGLRLIGSQLTQISLPLQTNSAGNSIGECGVFADSYTWGPVAIADIHLNGETASSVPIQIIGPLNGTNFPAAPTDCSDQTTGPEEDTVAAFGANGLLGVGVFGPDCGEDCAPATTHNPGVYFACDASSGGCSVITEILADQVQNPVPLFATDNNGVIVELPGIASGGAAGVSGVLVFGIGTQSNNGLGTAGALTLDGGGNFNTTFNGTIPGFMDSGSNALFFDDSSIVQCSGELAGFYCPSSTENLSAVMAGYNGASVTVPFSIANTENLNGNDLAFDDLGGTTGSSLSGFFDWGMPFFYGRNVYFAIQGQDTPLGRGPYNAFSSN